MHQRYTQSAQALLAETSENDTQFTKAKLVRPGGRFVVPCTRHFAMRGLGLGPGLSFLGETRL